MKNFSIIVVIVVLGGLIAAIVYYKQAATTVTKTLEAERYSRLVAEEKAVNSASKIKQLESDLKGNEDKISKIQSVLKEQKNLNQDLENQFSRLSKAKATLEEQLKTVINQPVPEPQQVNQTVPSQ